METFLSGITFIKFAKYIYNFTKDVRYTDKEVLDYWPCICKIALLKYYPVGTKLTFEDNSVNLQAPELLTPIKRYCSGDCRDDLGKLSSPIKKVIKEYISETNEGRKNNMKIIISSAIVGLKKLQNTYTEIKNNTIVLIIELYISSLTNSVNAPYQQSSDIISPDDTISDKTLESIKTLFELCDNNDNGKVMAKYTELVSSIVDEEKNEKKRI